jgi:hypothetical protein
MVKPTISGTIIDLLDHVLIGFLTPSATAASTFLRRCKSIKGPFFNDLGTITSKNPKLDLKLFYVSLSKNQFACYSLSCTLLLVYPKEYMDVYPQKFYLPHHHEDDPLGS